STTRTQTYAELSSKNRLKTSGTAPCQIAISVYLARMLNLTKGRLLAALCALTLSAPAVFAQQSAVKINEIQASNLSYIIEGSITDWVELINTSSSPVDISGASLTDEELS